MRATWTAAVLTAALGFTSVASASVSIAHAADVPFAASAFHTTAGAPPVVAHHPIVSHLPAAGTPTVPAVPVPAVPDPTKALDVLGALGGVLKLVTGLVSSVADPSALQKLLTDLQSAVQDLLGKLPAPPSLPVTPPSPALPVGEAPRSVPADLPVPVPAPVPAAVSPADALAKLQKDASALVAAATAAKPDPATVKNLVSPLSADAVTATTATATTLTTH
ncbi:hypothetical protein ABT095_36205 [Kitasatospora sp. NPDC002227]|uniref:hypothetical protein n=1 Tax=Kitasatospora sp. NPDC002227 TaxID=3154773 RepID=UPI00332606A9